MESVINKENVVNFSIDGGRKFFVKLNVNEVQI